MQKKAIIVAVLLAAAFPAVAQTFQQALFLDGYRLAYRYNPALQNEDSFLSVGQFVNQKYNNVGMANFFFPREGEVVTGLHSSVSADEFLTGLKKDNYTKGNINVNLASYGWRSGAAYHTVEANVRSQYSIGAPKSIFEFAKLGNTESTYDAGGIGIGENLYAELAYGYSYKLSDIVSVGARAKLLLGLEALNYRMSSLRMSLTEDQYKINMSAELDLTNGWRQINAGENGYLNLLAISARDRHRLPSGIGMALDFGVVVRPLEGLTLAASILDLGGMRWYYGNAGTSWNTISFSGFDDLSVADIQNGGIKKQLDELKTDLIDGLKLSPAAKKSAWEKVPFNVNLAVKYELPFYRQLAIGVTANHIGAQGRSYSEVRGVVGWNPVGWFGIAAGAGTGKLGPVWNIAANVAVSNFRLTLGLNDGFGGKKPYTSNPLWANYKVVTVGLTYDL
ncbi:MAG: hypothetical protein II613_04390 [Bacteroidales bacterium]|nr:hypothetical protein [Bacteroidales bacterium]